MKEIDELHIQKQIYLLVSEQPGLNLSKIADLKDISVELALYHLRYLEKNGLVSSEKEEGFLRFFQKGEVGLEDKKYLALFRQKTLLKIVLFVLKNPHSKHKEIVDHLSMSSSLLTYHLNKLVKKSIIGIQTQNDDQGYIVINVKEVIQFLVKYKSSNIFEGFTDSWADFTMKLD